MALVARSRIEAVFAADSPTERMSASGITSMLSGVMWIPSKRATSRPWIAAAARPASCWNAIERTSASKCERWRRLPSEHGPASRMTRARAGSLRARARSPAPITAVDAYPLLFGSDLAREEVTSRDRNTSKGNCAVRHRKQNCAVRHRKPPSSDDDRSAPAPEWLRGRAGYQPAARDSRWVGGATLGICSTSREPTPLIPDEESRQSLVRFRTPSEKG